MLADAPGREAEFEDKAGAFEHQAKQITDTAIQLANLGGNTNKRLLDQIRQNAQEVCKKANVIESKQPQVKKLEVATSKFGMSLSLL